MNTQIEKVLTPIDNIKRLYKEVKKKSDFLVLAAEDLNRTYNTLRHHWFGQGWQIPKEHQQRVIALLQNTIKKQNEK